jgi:hypothetical protein
MQNGFVVTEIRIAGSNLIRPDSYLVFLKKPDPRERKREWFIRYWGAMMIDRTPRRAADESV